MGGKKSLEPLLKALTNENEDVSHDIGVSNLRVQIEAAKALGQLGDAGAVDPLIRALDEEYYQVPASAAWALGELGDLRAVEPLFALAETKKGGSVNLTAIAALSRIYDPMIVDAFITKLPELHKTGYNFTLAENIVARTLGEVGLVKAGKLVDVLKNEEIDPGVLISFMGILGMMRAQDAVLPLADILANHKHFHVREMAVWSLAEIGDAQAVPALVQALEDKNKQVRQNTAWALGHIGGPDGVDALIARIQDDREKRPIMQNAAWALGKIGDDKALPSLIEALSNPDVGMVAYWSLKQITGEDFGIGTTEAIEAWERWYGEMNE